MGMQANNFFSKKNNLPLHILLIHHPYISVLYLEMMQDMQGMFSWFYLWSWLSQCWFIVFSIPQNSILPEGTLVVKHRKKKYILSSKRVFFSEIVDWLI